MNCALAFRCNNKKIIDLNLKFKLKYIDVEDEKEIEKYILYEGVSSYNDQYLVIRENGYFLKDVRLAFKAEKQIRENEIKYMTTAYDFEHSQILVCYTNKTPQELNIKYNLYDGDTIKLQQINVSIEDYKKQLSEKYKKNVPYCLSMYYINTEDELIFTPSNRTNRFVKVNEIKRIGNQCSCSDVYFERVKFEDC
ncbi:LANO_0C04720g1_1 [Lachancea nothofagi CBS 11611]|uniref:LANO_0C04720g1_1 n=1 Tax=Lachancea nothofagi CBS 11611 TaxID=1266666 RepID=A0A1G4J6V0_9SACH|nr:LANO_0C04720g1_1 [Lachancea nothofagi CBS 11611]